MRLVRLVAKAGHGQSSSSGRKSHQAVVVETRRRFGGTGAEISDRTIRAKALAENLRLDYGVNEAAHRPEVTHAFANKMGAEAWWQSGARTIIANSGWRCGYSASTKAVASVDKQGRSGFVWCSDVESSHGRQEAFGVVGIRSRLFAEMRLKHNGIRQIGVDVRAFHTGGAGAIG